MISIDLLFKANGINIALSWLEAHVTTQPGGSGLARHMQDIIDAIREEKGHAGLPQLIEIQAARQAYKKLGKDPSRYRPAAEALRRRILQGKELLRINNITDINNLISLKTGFSIGTYDHHALTPPLLFTKADESDTYHGIGRGPLNLTNLPVLKDQRGAFGSPTSDSERSMIRDDTKRVLMVFYLFGDGRPNWPEIDGLLGTYAQADRIEHGMIAN